MLMPYHHLSVLKREVVKYLNPKPGQNFIDCTLGAGGHAKELAAKVLPKGQVLGIDLDESSIKYVVSKKIPNLVVIKDNYVNLEEIIKVHFKYQIHGILLDLGLSSAQLESSNRGFSFQKDEELDMRFGTSESEITAKDIVNKWPEQELAQIFKQYGEEPRARKIAQAIVKARKQEPISTTNDLLTILMLVVGQKYIVGQKNKVNKKSGSAKGLDTPRSNFGKTGRGIHPATRVFQALRIATNNELKNLKQTLPLCVKVLEPGGRLAIISFHSLEDRIAKQFIKQESLDCICPTSFPTCQCTHKATLTPLTKKPVTAQVEELKSNPRSRSAKLRVAEKRIVNSK